MNVAFPAQNAFGSVHAAEHLDECLHRRQVGGMVQKNPAEIVAQGASRAVTAPVDFTFVFAGLAGEVAVDAGAGQADRPRVGAVSPAG